MRSLSFILAILPCIAGCDSEISRDYHKERVTITTETQQCHHTGYCCAYGLDFGGKYEFSCKMKINCPGKETVKVESVPYTATLKSGKQVERTSKKVLEVIKICR